MSRRCAHFSGEPDLHVLHALEEGADDLCQTGLGRRLVDVVLAGQENVVAAADGLEDGPPVDIHVRGGENG